MDVDVERAAAEIGPAIHKHFRSFFVVFEIAAIRIQEDWQSLRSKTGLDDNDLALAVHMVLRL